MLKNATAWSSKPFAAASVILVSALDTPSLTQKSTVGKTQVHHL